MRIFGSTKRKFLGALLFLPLIMILSAGSSPVAAATEKEPTPSDDIVIDWINFIKFNGVMYVDTTQNHPLKPSDLGPQYNTVKFMVAGNVHDPNYKVKDGDAAYWSRGSKVYRVKGYDASFRLALRGNDEIRLFEAFSNEHARKGSDLLDIAGKVQSIDIVSNQDGQTVLGSIKDRERVKKLIPMILSAPVQQDIQPEEQVLYFLVFHLADDTTVSRPYWPAAGVLGNGIMTPKKFRDAIIAALPHK